MFESVGCFATKQLPWFIKDGSQYIYFKINFSLVAIIEYILPEDLKKD